MTVQWFFDLISLLIAKIDWMKQNGIKYWILSCDYNNRVIVWSAITWRSSMCCNRWMDFFRKQQRTLCVERVSYWLSCKQAARMSFFLFPSVELRIEKKMRVNTNWIDVNAKCWSYLKLNGIQRTWWKFAWIIGVRIEESITISIAMKLVSHQATANFSQRISISFLQ